MPNLPPRLSLRRITTLSPRSLMHYLAQLTGIPSPEARAGDRGLSARAARAAFGDLRDPYLLQVLDAIARRTDIGAPVRLAARDCRSAALIEGCGEPLLRRRIVVLLERLESGSGTDGNGDTRGLVGAEGAAGELGFAGVPNTGARGNTGAEPPGHRRAPRLQAAFPVVVWLPHIRSPFNGGNVIRSAAAFGIAGVVVGDEGPSLDHPRLLRAAMGGGDHVAVRRGGLLEARAVLREAGFFAEAGEPDSGTPGNETSPPFRAGGPVELVLETGGTPIDRFSFPRGGVLIAGHEELGVPEEIVERARAEGRVVTIPHGGPKGSLNVGVAVGTCLSWWSVSEARNHPGPT